MRAHASGPRFLSPLLVAGLLLPSAALRAGQDYDAVLPNGLRVILIPHHANPMVASSVVVGAGVVHESAGMNGASHFLEHLLFNGSERRTQREIYDEVDRCGAYNNATTREDHTLFTLLIQKEFAETGLDIQADMLFHSILPQEKFDKEKGIVLEELAKDRNDPRSLAQEDFRAFAYAGTPLARPVLGSVASISALRRDDVYAYYKSRYVPSNMVLAVMGDFAVPRMLESVRKTFGTAPQGKPPAGAPGSWPAVPEKNFRSRPLDAGRTYVYAGFPLSLAPSDRDTAAVELLVAALSGSDDAPLRRVLTSGADPIALSFSLAVSPRTLPWSTLEFEAVLPKGQKPTLALEKLAEALQSPAVLAAARGRVAAVRAAARAEEVLAADQIHYYALMRSPYLLGSPEGSLSRRLAARDEAGEEALDRAQATLKNGLATLRASASGPDLPETVVPWRAPVLAPDAVTPTPRELVEEILPNGLEARIERNDDSRVFAVHLMFRPRAASEPAGREGIADFLHRLFLRGTLVHDRAALAARLDDLGARVKTNDDPSIPFDDYATTPEFSFVRLEMPADHWREGLALLAEITRFPRWNSGEIEAVRKEMLDLQKRRSESTRERAQDLMARTLAPGHPLSRPVLGTPESISSLTLDDLRAFHAAYVTGRRIILTEVSQVTPREVLEAVRAAFGDLPAGEEPKSLPEVPVTAAGRSGEEALGKEQASVALACVFDADGADEAALTVAGSLLADRLSFRLREERGLAYTLSASIAPFGGRMKFEAVMATRQANVDAALDGLKEEIGTFRETAPDAGAVARAAASLRGRLLMRRLTRVNQAYFAGIERMKGRPAGDDLLRLAALREVRAEDVMRVVRKYLDPDRFARVIVR